MELKTVIYIDINTQTKFTISDEKTLHQTLSGLWSQIYKLKHSHPIFCLEHRLVGTIDGCRVQSVPDTGKKLSIYVADNCETKDGKVFSCGGAGGDNNNTYSTFGFIGDGTTIPRFLPVLILENVKYIAIGSYSSFAIDKNGTLYGWGLNNAEEMLLYF